VTGVAIVDSGGANIASLRYALDRLGASSELTTDPGRLRRAERVILPGVGHASDAMARLRTLGLDSAIRELTQPVLGICLGMQLLFRASEEGGDATGGENQTECLGVIAATVRRMQGDRERPIPHMGWNRLEFPAEALPAGTTAPPPGAGLLPIDRAGATLLDGLENGVHMYFVHGYAAPVGPWTRATACYGEAFSAVVAERNFVGTQFHPERSAAGGHRLLENFLRLERCA
jgi:glutamine amidotransferase